LLLRLKGVDISGPVINSYFPPILFPVLSSGEIEYQLNPLTVLLPPK